MNMSLESIISYVKCAIDPHPINEYKCPRHGNIKHYAFKWERIGISDWTCGVCLKEMIENVCEKVEPDAS